MRFLHTADWHIGKKLHDFSLAEDQAAAFDQIERLAKDYQVDAVVIAGDLYDRGLASEQAVEQLNGMLKQLNLNDHLPLLAISGNMIRPRAWRRAVNGLKRPIFICIPRWPVRLNQSRLWIRSFSCCHSLTCRQSAIISNKTLRRSARR